MIKLKMDDMALANFYSDLNTRSYILLALDKFTDFISDQVLLII